MCFIICIGSISRHLEIKYYGRSKSRSLSYVTVEEFLSDLKKEFGREDDKTIKLAELKKVE